MGNKEIKLLIFNPGSTSTKIAIYENETPVFVETMRHPAEELKKFKDIMDQYDFRRQIITEWTARKGYDLGQFDAIVCRGGNFKPIPSGTYYVDESMVADAISGTHGMHATNVGCRIAFEMSRAFKIPALTVDPPVCDEFCDEARYSGLPQIQRQSSYHALNQKAIARRLARDLGKDIATMSAIVVHLGGGISVGAHSLGRVIDVNNALNGDGPFSPERAGGLPIGALITLCYSGAYTEAEMQKLVSGKGGLVAYLGTTDGVELEGRIGQGDAEARKVVEAMAYQIAKEIGGAAAVLSGRVEAIALTGGLANWTRLVNLISQRVGFIAPIRLYPGENEIESLALGALRVLRGEEKAKSYA